MREALKEVTLEVLGVKDDGGARIGLVTTNMTGLTDGIIMSEDVIIIEGEKIKIAPEDEAGIGVFFVNYNGDPIPLTHPIVQNEPKNVLVIVPHLIPGQYTLRIVTRYTHGSTLLKEPRVIEYDRPLAVN